MNPQNPIFIPHDIHVVILEFLLSDKSLYSSVERDYSYTSVSKWIELSLVCRAWRNRIHALVFSHLCVSHKNLADLRDLALSFNSYGNILPNMMSTTHIPTLNYVHNLTLMLAVTNHLPDAISILADLPHLNNLTIRLCVASKELSLGNSIYPEYAIPQVNRLCIRFFHETRSYIDLLNTRIRWILSCFPSTEHLALYSLHTIDDTDLNTTPHHSLPPNLISLASTGWFPGLFGRQLDIPTLRFLDIWWPTGSAMRGFANYHCNTLEGLRMAFMNLGIGHDPFWDDVMPKFSCLRYLSIGDEDVRHISPECIKSPHLRHVEFSTFFTDDELAGIAGITKFVTKDCPSLKVVTYHSDVRLASIHDLEEAGSLSVVWKHGMSLPALRGEYIYAIPYTC
ncbi:hypothetical protein BDV93DRAFT_310389 [Ceratobasidium sp. AG-I]|nr:hypothetical protein BDV93DRAFT_310389 [Ceratobasidium sp. AG-I]